MVKNLAGLRKTWVRFLGQEDALEKEMKTHFSILPGEFLGQRSLAGYHPQGCKESDTTEQLTLQKHSLYKKSLTKLFLKRKNRKVGRTEVIAFTSLQDLRAPGQNA